jgi:membrane-associated protease RseP (regulator of RpoE activity)
VQATQEYYVAPVIAPQPPQPQNEYYFGFSIQLVSDAYGGKTLRIVSVTPGSPAQQAGLEIGDEIRSVNGLGFLHAPDSFVAVNMLNRFVSPNPLGGGTVPATAAGVQAYVAPGHHHQPIANMIVRNVRNGQDVAVTVRPQPRAVVMPAPAAAAATVSQ